MTEETDSYKLGNGPIKGSCYMSLQDAVIDRISQGSFIHNLESYLEAVKRILWLKDKLNINSAPDPVLTLAKKFSVQWKDTRATRQRAR